MADVSGSTNTHLVVSDGLIQVTMGDVNTAIPVSQVDAFIQVLEAARLLANAAGATGRVTAGLSGAPGAELPAPPAAAATPAAPAKKKRRSRKRVGDALVVWMKEHPGWHTEEALLDAVVEHKMTDANPKRALKIALGKQRGELFDGDGHGHWKLSTDTTAGAPPKVSGRRRRSGRKARKSTSSVRKRADTGSRTSLGEKAKALSRSGRRVRLKTRPRTGAHAVPGVEDSGTDGDGSDPGEQRSAKVVRVKKGEDRVLAALSPSARKAREEASNDPPPMRRSASGRWGNVSREEVERARRNLLGLSGGSGAVGDGDE